MSSRADDIRRKMAKRKRDRDRVSKNIENRDLWAEDEERYGFNKMPAYNGTPGRGDHPLFRKELFLFKLLASACLFLIVAILFKNESPSLDPAKNLVETSMEKDFQFAAVSNWYEDQFGKPLALLPFTDGKEKEQSPSVSNEYALPASAKILEDFSDNGQRITIETSKGAPVEAMSEGLVEFAGMKDGFGKTVIIQHADKSESWYGNLEDINVNLYEYIKTGAELGLSAESEDGSKSSFYFAIKKGDDFIDPIQVIPFD